MCDEQRDGGVALMPRYDDAWIAQMLTPRRADLAPPEGLLARAGAGPGTTVVDLGCGPGFFTLPAAGLVGPRGRVFAIDVEPRMLEMVAAQAAARGLANVITLQAREDGVELPEGCADVVVCALVLHDLTPREREAMVGELARVCRAGGAVLVVEWQPRTDDTRWNRLAPGATADLLAGAGLRVEENAPLGEPAPGVSTTEGMYRVVARKGSLPVAPTAQPAPDGGA